ncbi:DNA-3-methyladenine glycosylase [Bacillus sp. TS-2]|nr:DNA-3-methyladenine glycosylase [Bacillus sp. TS-2]
MIWHKENNCLVITLPEFFDMSANISYLLRDENECLHEIENDSITKAIVVEGTFYLVKIRVIHSQQMIIQFLNDSIPIEKQEQKNIVKYIGEWFDLDIDLNPFYDMAKVDPLLNIPVQQFYGLRVIGIPDLFEALCWGVLGQQINLAFAYSLKRKLVEKFGNYIEWDGKKYWMFPTFDQIAKLTPKDLADIKMTIKKCEYIIGIAQMMERGELSKKQLKPLNFMEAEKKLMDIRGVGPWTANYVLMRCLKFQRAFPIDDVGLINSIKKLLNMNRKPTKDEILKLSTSWENWESYATFYLWRVLY